jgi:hypothetical protein
MTLTRDGVYQLISNIMYIGHMKHLVYMFQEGSLLRISYLFERYFSTEYRVCHSPYSVVIMYTEQFFLRGTVSSHPIIIRKTLKIGILNHQHHRFPGVLLLNDRIYREYHLCTLPPPPRCQEEPSTTYDLTSSNRGGRAP